jgi:hypothetical protein
MHKLHKHLLILLILQETVVGWWHSYDKNKLISEDCYQKEFRNKSGINQPWANPQLYQPNILTEEQIKKWKLWPGLFSSFDSQHGESLTGFQEALEAIWKNQHPADCSKAKFLIAEGIICFKQYILSAL